MRRVREITAAEENFRLEEFAPICSMVKRDPVEPEPVGTYIATVFRVTGYDKDCDGSLMARLEHVDEHGRATGWEENAIGLYPGSDIVLDSPSELFALADGEHYCSMKGPPGPVVSKSCPLCGELTALHIGNAVLEILRRKGRLVIVRVGGPDSDSWHSYCFPANPPVAHGHGVYNTLDQLVRELNRVEEPPGDTRPVVAAEPQKTTDV